MGLASSEKQIPKLLKTKKVVTNLTSHWTP